MLSFLLGNNNGVENSDQNNKIMNALGPGIAQNWPKIKPYADKSLAAAQDDATLKP
ncbi:hypothetical protein [Mucilaginibacter sp.]|uniref:hypothetical protein n=1 Tax=Mucilaginibacter sp. TaxID=1882438 RepID=UPI0035BC4D3D